MLRSAPVLFVDPVPLWYPQCPENASMTPLWSHKKMRKQKKKKKRLKSRPTTCRPAEPVSFTAH
jgi:hypothetical protein